MSAILATSGAIRTLVDGTLRISFDVEPKDAADAFAMFGKPGSPAALARITNQAAVEHDRKAQAQPPAEPLERKPLSLASKVALVCNEMSFKQFLSSGPFAKRWKHWRDESSRWDKPAGLSDVAALVVRDLCGVSSRSEIVPGSAAEAVWQTIETSYHHWQRTGAAA
jgi:hypothetical protein